MQAEIPAGWYRICLLAQLKFYKKITTNLFGGTVSIHYFASHHIEAYYYENVKNAHTLKIVEHNLFLFAWFPVEHPANFSLIPKFSLIRKDWSTPFHLQWIVQSNLLEISENAVDMAHFTSVHIYKEQAHLLKFSTTAHAMSVMFESARRILGLQVPVNIELHYQGLGWIESVVCSSLVEAYVLYTPTPINHKQLNINLSFSFKKSRNPLFNALLYLFLPWEVRRDFEKDIPIWENKIVHSHPILCAGDGPIMQLRRWAFQFYKI